MSCLTFKQILAKKIVRIETPEIEEGSHVCLRPLKYSELVDLQKRFGDQPTTDDNAFVAGVLHYSLCTDDGRQLSDSFEDALGLVEGNAAVFVRLAEAAIRHGGIPFVDTADKKKATLKSSPCDIANTSECSTPTTSTAS